VRQVLFDNPLAARSEPANGLFSSPSNLPAFKSSKKRRKFRKANFHSGLAAPEGMAQGRRTGGAQENPV
jgi:hypothetical protein